MADTGPEKLGRYQLLALLATGGMAEIYLARQTGIKGFERLVVVKRILPHLARKERFVEMFLDEARIAAQLSHPNIVQIFDLGHEDGEYYIAMEYLEGESLGHLAREAGASGSFLPPQLAAGIVAQVCDGLDYAHKLKDENGKPLKIVHRDVSPHNIIVLFSGGVKLVDFGIARAASQSHQTEAGTRKGKLTYMPPEQYMSNPVDARSDVFSLGAVMWELLTRRRLFKRENEAAVIQAILNEPVPEVREIRPDLAPDLAAVAMRALRRDPAERFQDAGEMGAAIMESLRATGAAAGMPEIAAFVSLVFAERAMTKQRLLEEIRSQGSSSISLKVLKPDTDESLPSRSQVENPEAEQETVRGGRVLVHPGKQPGKPDDDLPTAKRKRPLVDQGHASSEASLLLRSVMIAIPVLVVFSIVLLWLTSGETPPGERLNVPIAIARPHEAEPLPPQPDEPPASVAPDVAGARTALLSIRSKPSGCRIEIDGVEVPGLTPLEEVAVEAGVEHTVAASCKRHARQEKLISAGPDERLLADFAPDKLEPAVSKTGRLRLNTVPWSEVFLGRRRLGMTPLLGVKLPAGTYTLTAVNESKNLSRTFKVTIQAGRTTSLKIPLSK
ncbi:MAG TPA: serine/threonine-protein kinase [Myxococcota bacterium]|nr:serine/threonine-protein kinase [Myxococcota bacterium]